MQIPSTRLLLPLPATPLRQPLLQNLQPGQILQATTLSENHNGSVKLQIGLAKLIAQTQLSVRPGQTLTLQVEKMGSIPELKLLAQPSLAQLQANALKQILPRQQPLQPVFDKLLDIANGVKNDTIPATVKQSIETVIGRLLSTNTPQFRHQLREALLNSGIHNEARLLAQLSTSADLKLNLLRLFDLVKVFTERHSLLQKTLQGATLATSPDAAPSVDTTLKPLTQLLKLLDGALARIQTNQLASLPQEDTARQVWQFELPILHNDRIDLLQILIRQEQASSTDPPSNVWSLTLQMELPELGPMRVDLRLQGDALSTYLWADLPETARLAQQHLPSLQDALEKAGLQVQKLEAHQSTVKPDDPIPNDLSLLNEKA